MAKISRRESITWLAGSLFLAPSVSAAKHLQHEVGTASTADKCSVLFSDSLPPNAKHLVSEEKAGIFVAIFESISDLGVDSVDRWLCLAVKNDEKSLAIQVSKEVLLSNMPRFHPVDVELGLSGNIVDLKEYKIRGSVLQQWAWVAKEWVLLKKQSTDVLGSSCFCEEYSANQSKVLLTTGYIDGSGFDSVQVFQGLSHISLSTYDGNTSAC